LQEEVIEKIDISEREVIEKNNEIQEKTKQIE